MVLKDLRSVFALGVLCAIPLACKSADHSRLKGHLEDFSEAELQTYKGKLQVIPEHAESTGVIVAFEPIGRLALEPLIENFIAHPDKLKLMLVVYENELPQAEQLMNTILAKQGAERERVSYVVLPVEGVANEPLEWARDWGPWSMSYNSGSGARDLRLVEMNYFSEGRPRADSMPQVISKQMNVGRVSLPVRTEGGNFMANSRGDCIITEETARKEGELSKLQKKIDDLRQIHINSMPFLDRKNPESLKDMERREHQIARLERIKNSSTSYTQNQIETIYQDYLGCKNVHTLASSPADNNGHIDLFAKFIDDDTVVVAELEDETIDLAKKIMIQNQYHDPYLSFLEKVKSHLNTAAAQLSAKNFKVVRVPLPLPYFRREIDQEHQSPVAFGARVEGAIGAPHMRSYVNSLILNKKIYVPRFNKPGYDPHYVFPADYENKYVDADLLAKYEAKVKEGYGRAGLDVVFVDADMPTYSGGSIHCLTMQLGKVKP